MREHLGAVFASYPDVFFLRGGLLGLAMFAVTLANPNAALGGMVALVAAWAAARFIRMDRGFLGSGFYTYNALLVGLSLGYLFELSSVEPFLIVSAGIFGFLLTTLMAHLFQTYLQLPILSLPFVVVSSVAYLASLRYSNLLVAPTEGAFLLGSESSLPWWLAGFFEAWGAILFVPGVIPGLLLSLTVLSASRILFLLSALGYYAGTSVRALMLGSAQQAFTDSNSFNFILIAMAVGGVYLVPSLASYLLAVVAVALSTLLLDSMCVFWSFYGIPVFTLPFNVTTLSLVYVLGLMRYPRMAASLGSTPEETLERDLTNRLRYPGEVRTLFLPFSGRWTVWQGFDGAWTHKGSWRHAYDFVITDDEGRTHRGGGARLEDYHCYRKSVLSPVRGRVVKVVDGLPDNLAGDVDDTHNWGNLVLIEDPRGFFVEISHLACNTFRVMEGAWVERGATLGLTGNSGYSPQPHIHVQVQGTNGIGAGTLPFSFVSYSDGVRFHANDRPAEGDRVEPLYADKRLERTTAFRLDEVHQYVVEREGEELGRLRLEVKLAADGSFAFESERGRLFFGKYEGTFYFYRVDGDDPWLGLMLLALPRLPLAWRERMVWRDFVPVGSAVAGPRRMAAQLMTAFWPRLGRVETEHRFAEPTRIVTTVRSRLLGVDRRAEVILDPDRGFRGFRVDDVELRRVDP